VCRGLRHVSRRFTLELLEEQGLRIVRPLGGTALCYLRGDLAKVERLIRTAGWPDA
jgi:hypothetical protein